MNYWPINNEFSSCLLEKTDCFTKKHKIIVYIICIMYLCAKIGELWKQQ